MVLKCSTCKITLDKSAGHHLGLDIPELKSKLILIVQECLHGSAANLQESELICNGCKVQFILFYQFKTKTTKLLEKQNIKVKLKIDTKPNIKRGNSNNNDENQSNKKLKPKSPEKASKQASVMKYKCLTCNKDLDEASANHMNLEFPDLEKDVKDRFREIDKDKDLNLKYIIENCLSIKVQDSRVICDGCKNHLLASYTYKLEARKTVKDRKFDNEFKIIHMCTLCGATDTDEEFEEYDLTEFKYYHIGKDHRQHMNIPGTRFEDYWDDVY